MTTDATIATPIRTETIISAIPDFCNLALRGTRSKKVHIHNPDFGGFSYCGLEGLISGCVINAMGGNPNNHFTYVEYDSENEALVPVDDCLNHAEDMAAKLKPCQKCVKELLSEPLEETPEKKERMLIQLIGNRNDDNHDDDNYRQGTERPFKLIV